MEIDADKLITEIERQMKDVERHSDLGEPDDLYYDGRRSILVMLRSFIDTLIPERSENDMRLCNLIAKCIALGKQKGLVNDDDEIACLDILKRKDRSLSKYDKDMLKIIIGELIQEGEDVNVPGMYEFEINWLKSFFGL